MPFFRFKPMLPFPGCWVVAILALAISVPFHVSAVGFIEPAAIAVPLARNFDTSRFGSVSQKPSNGKIIVHTGAVYAPKFEGSNEFKASSSPMISGVFADSVGFDADGLTR
jgi:outer membrane protein